MSYILNFGWAFYKIRNLQRYLTISLRDNLKVLFSQLKDRYLFLQHKNIFKSELNHVAKSYCQLMNVNKIPLSSGFSSEIL